MQSTRSKSGSSGPGEARQGSRTEGVEACLQLALELIKAHPESNTTPVERRNPGSDGYACAVGFRLAIGLMVATACSGPPVEEGLFFPTWDAGGDVPAGIVQGVLVEKDRCLFVERSGRRTLVVWEAGLGFEDNALLDSGGDPIASAGETIHGGGGYYGDRGHIENLAGEPVPERCVPMGNSDRFALIYGVEAGPFE
jgi:hypothetical protein